MYCYWPTQTQLCCVTAAHCWTLTYICSLFQVLYHNCFGRSCIAWRINATEKVTTVPIKRIQTDRHLIYSYEMDIQIQHTVHLHIRWKQTDGYSNNGYNRLCMTGWDIDSLSTGINLYMAISTYTYPGISTDNIAIWIRTDRYKDLPSWAKKGHRHTTHISPYSHRYRRTDTHIPSL